VFPVDVGRRRRSRRSFWFFSIPLMFLGISASLLMWAIVRANLPPSVDSQWPWRVQLLDIGSATTMTTVTAGLVLARAQFASAVRPVPAYTGRVARVRGFSSRYVWVVRVLNNSASPAGFHSLEYCVTLQSQPAKKFGNPDRRWGTREEAIRILERIGLRDQIDFDLRLFWGFSLSNSSPIALGIFSTKAMGLIEDITIRMVITDQAGDSRPWTMACLTGAVRRPRNSHID
jgi:hypothetical protein